MRTVLRRNLTLVIFLTGLALAGSLGALHFAGEAGGGPSSLSILSPHGDNIRQEVGAGFQSWHQARYGQAPELNWIDQGGASEGLRYVLARFAENPSSIGIDLFFGGGVPPFRTLARAGLLRTWAIGDPILEDIPASLGSIRLHSQEEGWYGVALAGFGMLYNRRLLKEKDLPIPSSWTDLAEPRARGWVASVDPRGSGSAHVIYEIILQKHGWEKGWEILTRIAANSDHFTKGASGVLPLVSSGEAAYAVAIDQYAWSLVEKLGDARVGFTLPPGETVTTPDPVAMLKGAPNPLASARFMEYLLSESCQWLWTLKAGVPRGPARMSLNRMSVSPRVASRTDSTLSHVRGNPFADAAGMDWAYSDSLTESRWGLINDALGLWMVDSHAAARRRWDAINAGHPRESRPGEWRSAIESDRFFRPPAPWEGMREMAARWTDDAFRNETMARWARSLDD